MGSIRIDEKSSVPIFQQIVNEIERLILVGELKEEAFIPSVREIAVNLAINPNTVAKAYNLLQINGLVEAIRGTGLRVLKQSQISLQKKRKDILIAKVSTLITEAEALGFVRTDVIETINAIKPRRG